RDRGARIRSVSCTVGQINPPSVGSTARKPTAESKGSKAGKESKEKTAKQSTVAKASGVFGREGPHCMAVSDDGRLVIIGLLLLIVVLIFSMQFTWGTCHKGILGNMRDKVLIV